jgi:putative transcriptional regulator
VSEPSVKGRLLLATSALTDPNFRGSVVLVIQHGPEGTLGVVLNRPTRTALVEVVPSWADLAARPRVVFSGGPVQRGAAICLAERADGDRAQGWTPLFGRLGTLDLDIDPELVRARLGRVRLFAGYAGWSPGQLEAEIEAGGWFVLEAEPDDPFSNDPQRLWRQVLRRQRGELRILAHYPTDPTSN